MTEPRRRVMQSRSCMSIGMLVVLPLVFVAFIAGLVTNSGTLRPSQWLLFPGLALLLFTGWIALLAGMLRGRAGERLSTAAPILAVVGLSALGIGGIWFGVEGFTSHRTSDEQPLITLLVGLLMLVAGGLVVFRKHLPWNRPRPATTEAVPKLHRVRLRDHLGEVRVVRLDSKIPAEAIANSHGVIVPSRFAWVFADAGLSKSAEVAAPGSSISSWDLLATETTDVGTITFRVPRASALAQQFWHTAAQERA